MAAPELLLGADVCRDRAETEQGSSCLRVSASMPFCTLTEKKNGSVKYQTSSVVFNTWIKKKKKKKKSWVQASLQSSATVQIRNIENPKQSDRVFTRNIVEKEIFIFSASANIATICLIF